MKSITSDWALLLLTWSSFSIFLAGCVDINTANISTKDYRSQVRFVNLADSAGTATSIRIDSDEYGSVAFGDGGGYKDIPAGLRSLSFIFSQAPETTFARTFETDRKGTCFIVRGDSAVEYLFATERYIFESPGVTDTALIRVLNASPDVGVIHVTATPAGPPITLANALAFRTTTDYQKVAASSYTLLAISGPDTLVNNAVVQFDSNKRYTIALYDRKTTIKQKQFVDD